MTGTELRTTRTQLGLTQAQLGHALGMHANTIACMERGVKRITSRTAAALGLLLASWRRNEHGRHIEEARDGA